MDPITATVATKVLWDMAAVAATAVALKPAYDNFVKSRKAEDGDFVNGFLDNNINRAVLGLTTI
ncbi:MAG: hypothetical protein U9O94_02225 [Nanoarchaeota archaeon]|nr:hypothetical protein [Nanoarchaeota archaeon]